MVFYVTTNLKKALDTPTRVILLEWMAVVTDAKLLDNALTSYNRQYSGMSEQTFKDASQYRELGVRAMGNVFKVLF